MRRTRVSRRLSGYLLGVLTTVLSPAAHAGSQAFFFFPAEDGIRDKLVTGVQTCALPISYRTVNAVDGSRNHANPGSAFDLNFRNLAGQNALVSRSSHLEPGREVDPQLESVDPFRPDLGHLLMHDAAAGGHPLNVARSNA